MRGFGLVAVALAGVAMPAAACDGSTEVLKLVDWSAAKGKLPNSAAMTLKFRNDGDQAVRMVDASLSFVDVLDQPVGLGVKVGPDLVVEAGGEVTQEFTALGWDRLTVVAHEDVIGTVCLRAAVLADGSKADF